MIRIIIYSLMILILSGILISVLFFDLYATNGRVHMDHFEATEAPLVVSNDVVSDDIKNLEIEWVAGSIIIAPESPFANMHLTTLIIGWFISSPARR